MFVVDLIRAGSLKINQNKKRGRVPFELRILAWLWSLALHGSFHRFHRWNADEFKEDLHATDFQAKKLEEREQDQK